MEDMTGLILALAGFVVGRLMENRTKKINESKQCSHDNFQIICPECCKD